MTSWQVTLREEGEEGLPEHIKVSLIKRDGESKKTVKICGYEGDYMITLHGKFRLFPETKFLGRSRLVRLRANGRNIVDQQLPTLLDVQTDATLLTNNSQHCWMCKRTQHCWLTTPDIVGSFCARLHLALNLKLI